MYYIFIIVIKSKLTYSLATLLLVFHCYSITVNILSVLRVGATIDIMDGFIPDKIVNKLELKNITVFSGAPVMYNLLLKYLKKEDYNKLSNVRLWLSGGSQHSLGQTRNVTATPNCQLLIVNCQFITRRR